MTVCCPLSGDYDDGPTLFTDEVRRARRAHTCCECRETIPIGARYENSTGMWDGRWSTYKTCLSCVEIRNHFGCSGWIYEHVWSDIEENFFPDMRAGGRCMEGLSPAAKSRLFDLRMKWLYEYRDERDGARPPWMDRHRRSCPRYDEPSMKGPCRCDLDPADPADVEEPELGGLRYLMTDEQRALDDREREREIKQQIWWMFHEDNPENANEVRDGEA